LRSIVSLMTKSCFALLKRKMGIVAEVEKTLKMPRIAVAILSIIIGVLILVYPNLLNILVALFLIVWGVLEAVKAGSASTKPSGGTA